MCPPVRRSRLPCSHTSKYAGYFDVLQRTVRAEARESSAQGSRNEFLAAPCNQSHQRCWCSSLDLSYIWVRTASYLLKRSGCPALLLLGGPISIFVGGGQVPAKHALDSEHCQRLSEMICIFLPLQVPCPDQPSDL